MGVFKFAVSMRHYYYVDEDVTITVEAETLKDAEVEAMFRAESDRSRSCWNAEYDYTDSGVTLESHIPDDGEEPITVRCDRTPDMFSKPTKFRKISDNIVVAE